MSRKNETKKDWYSTEVFCSTATVNNNPMMDRGRYANVVSMGIIPKMYFVTEEISIPYELHWFVDSNVALIFQRRPTSCYIQCVLPIILLDGHLDIKLSIMRSLAKIFYNSFFQPMKEKLSSKPQACLNKRLNEHNNKAMDMKIYGGCSSQNSSAPC